MNLQFNTLIEFKENAFPLFDCAIDAIEIEAIHEEDNYCTPIRELDDPREIHYWSVYAHRENGGVICLADCKDNATANQLAALFSELMVRAKQDSPFLTAKEMPDHLGSFSIDN
jgi:hypothetical protein